MKPILLISAVITYLAFAQANDNFLRQTNDEELLMVFEVTRHGARGGVKQEILNTTLKSGELTSSGKRQHYLIGQQMQQRYIKDLKLLSESYNPKEIYVRATDYNRTIESAESQLMGLYQSSVYIALTLADNQTSQAIAELSFSESDLALDQLLLGTFGLPNGYQPLPIHVYSQDFDTFQPPISCPMIDTEIQRRKGLPDLINKLNVDYNETLVKLALGLGFDSGNFTSFDAVKYVDNLWARYFEEMTMPEALTSELLDQAMLLYADYYNDSMSMNETTRKLFVTGMLSEVIQRFEKRVSIDKDDSQSLKDNILKFFYYSDHDDSIVTLSTAFKYHLPKYAPFASQIIYELWRKDSSYYVNMTINEVKIPLHGPCNGQFQCSLSDFTKLIKDISYYDNQEEYSKLCGHELKLHNDGDDFALQISSYQPMYIQGGMGAWNQVMLLYCVMMIVVSICWVIYCARNKAKEESLELIGNQEIKSDKITDDNNEAI